MTTARPLSSEDEDPYAVSSESDDEDKKPPPMIDMGVKINVSTKKQALVKRDDECSELSLEQVEKMLTMMIGVDGLAKLHAEIKDKSKEAQEHILREEQKRAFKRDARKKRVEQILLGIPDKEQNNKPKACAVCQQIAYKSDQVKLKGRVYHSHCFVCVKCKKLMTLTTFNYENGSILCKVHKMALTDPDKAAKLNPQTTPEDTHKAPDSDDEEFDGTDSIEFSRLDDKVRAFTENANQDTSEVVKRGTEFDETIFQKGAVKERMSRIVDGGTFDEDDSDDENAGDPNIVKSSRPKKNKEKLHFENTKSLKDRWASGGVETAESMVIDRNSELEELKQMRLKERFQEYNNNFAEDNIPRPKMSIDGSGASEAMRRFKEGTAWQEDPNVDKGNKEIIGLSEIGNFKQRFEQGIEQEVRRTEIEARCQEIGNIKSAFEQGKFERSEQEAQIEKDILGCAELGNIKDRFEKGEMFTASEIKRTVNDYLTEIKAGNLRAKFEASQDNQSPTKRPEQIKLTDEEVAEVGTLINRFKQIETGEVQAPTKRPGLRAFTPPPGDNKSAIGSNPSQSDAQIMPSIDAKNLAARFEHGQTDAGPNYDEKKLQLEEEFAIYKALKEQQAIEVEQSNHDNLAALRDEELAIIAKAHSRKMAQKWEKIQAKEAKKAARGAPKRPGQVFKPIITPDCFVCGKKVYAAEKLECDGRPLHAQCYKCQTCQVRLRPETYALGADGGIYCVPHHKEQFNNMAKPLFDARCHFALACQ